MRIRNLVTTLTLVLFFTCFSAFSSTSDEVKEGGSDLKTEIKEFIQHHLKDSYDFGITSWKAEDGTTKHFGLPLPIILFDEGMHVFMSSKFHHGETVAESNGKFYKVYHSKIYRTDAAGTITYDEHHHATNTKPFDFSITKNVVAILFIA